MLSSAKSKVSSHVTMMHVSQQQKIVGPRSSIATMPFIAHLFNTCCCKSLSRSSASCLFFASSASILTFVATFFAFLLATPLACIAFSECPVTRSKFSCRASCKRRSKLSFRSIAISVRGDANVFMPAT